MIRALWFRPRILSLHIYVKMEDDSYQVIEPTRNKLAA
jgi:hypothetical protein